MQTKTEDERLIALDLDACRPDTAQPRRVLPEDLHRQHAENVHRDDLSAVAKARIIACVREHAADVLLGTSGSQKKRELDDLTGQRLAELTGRAISGRMVRNYLSLLSLPAKAQELAEAACLTERTLRPLVSLDSPADQVRLVHALASGTLTPAQVKREVKQLEGQERPPASAVTRLWKSMRLVAEGLPRAEILAAEIAMLPEEKRRKMADMIRRHADLLNDLLETGELTDMENLV